MRAPVVMAVVALLAACVSPTADSGTPDARPTSSTTVELEPIDLEGRPASVDRVLDGDSIDVIIDGIAEEVRLQGINAPERDECLGDVARDRLRELLASGEVEVIEQGRDQFGRLLAIVTVDGIPANVAQVVTGVAIPLASESPIDALVLAAEASARTEQIGLWDPESCGSGPLGPVSIVGLDPNPPGPDDEVLDEEWVEIRNDGNSPIDLTGWQLRDESTANRYRFEGLVLDAGARVRIITGCDPAPGELAWCAERPVWNNDGDTALLVDADGRFVDLFRYRDDG